MCVSFSFLVGFMILYAFYHLPSSMLHFCCNLFRIPYANTIFATVIWTISKMHNVHSVWSTENSLITCNRKSTTFCLHRENMCKLENESFKLFMRPPNKQFTQFTISLFWEFCLSKMARYTKCEKLNNVWN